MSQADDLTVDALALGAQTEPHARRTFLRRVGIGSGVAVGALAMTSAASAAEPDGGISAATLRGAAARAGGPVSFYVRNAATGELGVLVGEREAVITEPELLNRLLTAVIR